MSPELPSAQHEEPLTGPSCARHPQVAAHRSCGRCGTFMCSGCERRVRLRSLPMCAGCWELRAAHLLTLPQAVVPGRTGLLLGWVSLLPLPPIQVISLVVNTVELSRASAGQRWRSAVGLSLTVIGGLGFFFLLSLGD